MAAGGGAARSCVCPGPEQREGLDRMLASEAVTRHIAESGVDPSKIFCEKSIPRSPTPLPKLACLFPWQGFGYWPLNFEGFVAPARAYVGHCGNCAREFCYSTALPIDSTQS